MFVSRRRILAAGGSLILAGCSNPATLYAGSGEVTLEYRTFERYDFDVDSPITLRYTLEVLSGPSVDVVVLDASEVSAFEADEDVSVINGATQFDTRSVEVRSNIPAGNWVLLLDNSDRGRARSDAGETAVVAFDYEVQTYIAYGSGQD